MQLLQAISMLLLGSVLGILCTLFDVAVVGGPAFFTRLALWMLFNVVFATHIRNRWRAVWWSVPFNLGLVESYFISTSFSFENISRSLAVPLALLALVAPIVVALSWTARHERRNLYGRLLGVVFALAMLVASSVTVHAVTVGNVVCTLLSLLVMFFVPTHTVAMVELDGNNHVVRVEGAGVSHHEPRERLSASRQMRQRQVRRQSREQKRLQRRSAEGRSIQASQAGVPENERASQVRRSRGGATNEVERRALRGKQGASLAGRRNAQSVTVEQGERLEASQARRAHQENRQRNQSHGERVAAAERHPHGAKPRRPVSTPSRPATTPRVPSTSAGQRPAERSLRGEEPGRGAASRTLRPHKRQGAPRSAEPRPSQPRQRARSPQREGHNLRARAGVEPHNHSSRRQGTKGQQPHARRRQ